MQISHPCVANELAVAHKRGDLHVWKHSTQTIQKIGSLKRVRVPRLRQQRPDQRYPHVIPDHRNHQDIDRRFTELPVGPVHGQNPRLAEKGATADFR